MQGQEYQEVCQIKAPGKAILCGEFAVIYGQDAIAMGIGLHCTGRLLKRAKQTSDARFTIALDIEQQPIDVCQEALQLFNATFTEQDLSNLYELYQTKMNERFPQQITKSIHFVSLHFKVGLFMRKFRLSWPGWSSKNEKDYRIQVKSTIPLGKCLGSSAAFNTVLATTLLVAFRPDIVSVNKGLDNETKELINAISVLFESVEHGNPSGIDNFVSVHGGLILFNKQRKPKFKKLEKAAHRLKQSFDIAIADSKIAKNTKKAVDMIRKHLVDHPQDKDKISRIGVISKQMLQILQGEEQIRIQDLFKLITQNHAILCDFGLSHQELQRLLKLGKQNGWTGKITGSGMGGCILLVAANKQGKQTNQIQLAQLDEQGLTIKFSLE